MILGFALTTFWWPWSYGDAGASRWIVAALGISIYLWRTPRVPIFSAGLGFLAWACLSAILIAPNRPDAIYELLELAILAAAFCVGTIHAPAIFLGAAYGLVLNSAIVLAQVFGLTLIPQVSPPSGLFGNRDWVAETAALVLTTLPGQGRLILAAALLPAALLPLSRAALVALGAATLFGRQWRYAAAAAGVALILSVWKFHGGLSSSDALRFEIWRGTLDSFRLLGWGTGQFYSSFGMIAHSSDWITQHAHNDWLELLFEFGPIGLTFVLVACFQLCLSDGDRLWRTTFFSFLCLCFFSFSVHNPATAILGFLAAGRVYGTSSSVRLGRSPVPSSRVLGESWLAWVAANRILHRPLALQSIQPQDLVGLDEMDPRSAVRTIQTLFPLHLLRSSASSHSESLT